MQETEICLAALAKPPDERAPFLDRACAADADLRRRVDAALGEYQRSDGAWATTGPPTDHRSARVGRYKLLQRLGEGGMGEVWLAEQAEPILRKVAVKLIKPGMDSAQVVARFDVERQALALMDHPNISKALDAGISDEARPFFVMELVKGVPITRFCDERKLTTRERIELFVPVCHAIQHAHQKGIIHRDVKPSNVLVELHDDKPVPKVIDFGLAKAMGQRLTERTMFTAHGGVVGTPAYMSPEQASLNAVDVDTRSDIYSLGVTLYELLTGSPPFDIERLQRTSIDEMLRIIREEDPPRPSEKLSTSSMKGSIAAMRSSEPGRLGLALRGELDWILLKCLEKDRTRRYESANALARDIQRHLADESVEACPPSAAYRLQKLIHRHKRAIVTAAVFALLLICGTAISVWQALSATYAGERERAVALQMQVERDRAEKAEQDTKAERDAVLEEKKRADAQAELAMAVKDFLQLDLLRFASPYAQVEGDGEAEPDLKVRTLLERASRNIEQKFSSRPDVEAEVRTTIGRAWHGMGEYDRAVEQHQKAFDIRSKALGPDHPLTLASASQLGIGLARTARQTEAIPLLENVLNAHRTRLGPDHADTLGAMSNLALAYSRARRFQEAFALNQKTLETRKAKLSAHHPDTLTSMNNLALSSAKVGKDQEAVALLEETLSIAQKRLGPRHPSTLLYMTNLACAYREVRRDEDALRLLEQSARLHNTVYGADNSKTLLTTRQLSVSLLTAGRPEQAIPWLEDSLKHLRANLGPGHRDTLSLMSTLAYAYDRANRAQDAVRLSEELLSLAKDLPAGEGPNVEPVVSRLIRHYREAGRQKELIPLYEQQIASQIKRYGPDHGAVAIPQTALALAYDDLGRFAEAEPCWRDIAAKQRQSPNELALAGSLAMLERSLRRQQKAAAAGEVLQDLKRISENRRYSRTWLPGYITCVRGSLLASEKKFAEAEPVLLAGYVELRDRAATGSPTQRSLMPVILHDVADRLAALYDSWSKPEKAAEWRKKADEHRSPPKAGTPEVVSPIN